MDTLLEIPCIPAPNGTTLWDAWADPLSFGTAIYSPRKSELGLRFRGHAVIREANGDERHDGTNRTECDTEQHRNCSFRGVCLRSFHGRHSDRDEHGGEAHCACFRNYVGFSCDLGLGVDGWCFDGCRGNGKCVLGTCVCNPGFWCATQNGKQTNKTPTQSPHLGPCGCGGDCMASSAPPFPFVRSKRHLLSASLAPSKPLATGA